LLSDSLPEKEGREKDAPHDAQADKRNGYKGREMLGAELENDFILSGGEFHPLKQQIEPQAFLLFSVYRNTPAGIRGF
jgi:hypothetical protein